MSLELAELHPERGELLLDLAGQVGLALAELLVRELLLGLEDLLARLLELLLRPIELRLLVDLAFERDIDRERGGRAGSGEPGLRDVYADGEFVQVGLIPDDLGARL